MSATAAEPIPVRLDERLFESSMAPEAILVAWGAPQGAWIEQGERLAEVLVEDMRHEIIAPVSGRLIDPAPASGILEPGDLICRLAPGDV